ncbi:hypothetical protein D3C86_1721330 [compost metagenome]
MKLALTPGLMVARWACPTGTLTSRSPRDARVTMGFMGGPMAPTSMSFLVTAPEKGARISVLASWDLRSAMPALAWAIWASEARTVLAAASTWALAPMICWSEMAPASCRASKRAALSLAVARFVRAEARFALAAESAASDCMTCSLRSLWSRRAMT